MNTLHAIGYGLITLGGSYSAFALALIITGTKTDRNSNAVIFGIIILSIGVVCVNL